MGHIEELVASYKAHITAPWQRNLAGAQKTVFVVYPKTEERRLRARLELFEIATTAAGHGWLQFDFTSVFAKWMAATEYREDGVARIQRARARFRWTESRMAWNQAEKRAGSRSAGSFSHALKTASWNRSSPSASDLESRRARAAARAWTGSSS